MLTFPYDLLYLCNIHMRAAGPALLGLLSIVHRHCLDLAGLFPVICSSFRRKHTLTHASSDTAAASRHKGCMRLLATIRLVLHQVLHVVRIEFLSTREFYHGYVHLLIRAASCAP
jgi:hypothetical protein